MTKSTQGFRLRHLIFLGPDRDDAAIEFAPGLNVLVGASETGKSFVVQALDFMLGGHTPLRDIPERVGYDRVLLGIETQAGDTYTLERSAEGGAFRVADGLLTAPLPPESRVLGDQHNERSADNLSMFLLECCGLAGRRLRKNKVGETVSLSFRQLARLVVVDETSIMARMSPLSDGNPNVETTNLSALKLLLTGVDDSALDANISPRQAAQSRESQLDLLERLIAQQRQRLRELTRDPSDVAAQLDRIEAALAQRASALTAREADYRRLVAERRDLRKRVEEGRDRQAEVRSLLERFALLERHYTSDVARLRGIQESGTLFQVMGAGPCPLCGALPEHHHVDGGSDEDVSAVVAAAGSEIVQIEVLQRELRITVGELQREALAFEARLPPLERRLQKVSAEAEEIAAPELGRMRTSYKDLAEKRGSVQAALSVLQGVQQLEDLRAGLEGGDDGTEASSAIVSAIPVSVAEAFARGVERILGEWHFPGPERVFFDQSAKDLIIAGKPRTSRGKGLRAITHAAFTIGILDHCRKSAAPHPGFVVLDSPLLAYREPEGTEDDLSGTDLQARFYESLDGWPDDRQVLVVENVRVPEDRPMHGRVTVFTGNRHFGRYGFFPPVAGMRGEGEPGQLA